MPARAAFALAAFWTSSRRLGFNFSVNICSAASTHCFCAPTTEGRWSAEVSNISNGPTRICGGAARALLKKPKTQKAAAPHIIRLRGKSGTLIKWPSIGAAQATPAQNGGALGLAYDLLLAGGNIAVDFGADADFGHDGFVPHIDNSSIS